MYIQTFPWADQLKKMYIWILPIKGVLNSIDGNRKKTPFFCASWNNHIIERSISILRQIVEEQVPKLYSQLANQKVNNVN